MEVGLCLYNALFVVRCYFKANANDSNSEAFVRGAVFEALETIDIVQLILGSEQIVTQLAEKCATKNINFVKAVYGLTKKVVTGTLATQDTKAQVKEVLSVFLPPCVDIAMIEKGLVLADTLRSKFKENKWYNSGRIATIVVPLVITGGAYAYTKIRSLTSGLTLTTATILENTISLNEKLIAKGLYLEENAGKTLIKKIYNNEVITVEGTGLTDVEKAVDDVVLQGAGSLAEAFTNGWTKAKILALPKGSRPLSTECLKPEFISNHLAKFESEGTVSRIVSKNDYNSYGVGKPDLGKTEFVGLKSEIDEILNLPINERAAKLGVPVEQLQNGNLVRIDFKLSNNYKVQMPTGNEFGANSQCIPGGKLPTGLNEAVIKTEGMQLNVNYFVKDL